MKLLCSEAFRGSGIDLARERSNRNVRRVLYYYRYKGLITPPIRKMVGKRLTLFYHNIVVSEILTIRLLKERGKSLDEIAEYMKKGVEAEFVSSVCDAVRGVEERFGIEPDTGMVTFSSLSRDGQFIYMKTSGKNAKIVREMLERTGFEPDTVTDVDIDDTVK